MPCFHFQRIIVQLQHDFDFLLTDLDKIPVQHYTKMPKAFQFGNKKRHSKARGISAVARRQRMVTQLEENMMEKELVNAITASSSSSTMAEANTKLNPAPSSANIEAIASSSLDSTTATDDRTETSGPVQNCTKMPKNFRFGHKKRHSKARGMAAVAQRQRIATQLEENMENELLNATTASSSSSTMAEANTSLNPAPSSANVEAIASSSSAATATDCTETSAPETRIEGKLAAFNFLNTDHLGYSSGGHYILMHTDILSSLISILSCPTCHALGLCLHESTNMGLAVKLIDSCDSCGSELWSDFSSPRGPNRLDINSRVVLASKEVGVGYAKLKSMFSIMNVPNKLSKQTYQDVSSEVHDAAVAASEQSMNQAADVVKERYACGALVSDKQSALGCPVNTVSFDGTWQKRGFSSHNGVGVVIDVDTGLVIDSYTVCNFCVVCEQRPKDGTQAYHDWYEKHSAVCQKKSDCSSNGMEVVAADKVFSRSIEKRGLIYGNMLCDGDSKAFQKANETCGYDIDVTKLDCINHIAKRMFNSLETVKRENKSELNRKLTRPMIDKITNTYTTNLKNNAPDVEQMKLGVKGGILHMCSTDSAPNHRLCPKGDTSWCPYQKAVARHVDPPPHRPTLKPDIVPFIWPTIVRLTSSELLDRCAKMLTQNANESFNAQIWRRCPKTDFANRMSVETAVALATLAFNCGPFGLRLVMIRLGLRWERENHMFASRAIAEKVSRARRKWSGSQNGRENTENL